MMMPRDEGPKASVRVSNGTVPKWISLKTYDLKSHWVFDYIRTFNQFLQAHRDGLADCVWRHLVV